MKRWETVSLLGGLFLLMTGVIWSVAVGQPVWDQFMYACANEQGCTIWGQQNGQAKN